MDNKLIHLYTCAKNIATQEWANSEQCLYEESLAWYKYNMSIENYAVLTHTRIVLYIDVFAKHEFVEVLTMYAESNEIPLSFIFTVVNTEYSYVSGTLRDWVLFVTYCERNAVNKCDWRYCLNQAYSDIFDCLINKQYIKSDCVGATVLSDTQLMLQCNDFQRHKCVTVRLEGTPDSILNLVSIDSTVSFTLGVYNDKHVECYITATIAQWGNIMRKLETQDVYHRTQILREMSSVVYNNAGTVSNEVTHVQVDIENQIADYTEIENPIDATGTAIDYDFWHDVDATSQEINNENTTDNTFIDTLVNYNKDIQEDITDTVLLCIDDADVTPETVYITE